MSWSKPDVKGEVPCERHSASITAVGSDVYLFGGAQDIKAHNDVYKLDTTKWTWSAVAAAGEVPPPRWGHSCVLLGPSTIVMFGGEVVGGKSNDVYLFDVATHTWKHPMNITGAAPSGRVFHGAVARGNKMYIFGGDGGDNNLYEFDLATMVWTRVATTGASPQIRKKTSLTLFGNTLVLFGGVDLINYQYLQDFHVLSLDSLEWIQPAMKGPIADARGGHTSCVLAEKLFVWGGESQKSVFNELHYVDPNDNYMWFKKKGMGSVPVARVQHSATLIGDKWLVFGGDVRGKPTNEVAVLTPSGIY